MLRIIKMIAVSGLFITVNASWAEIVCFMNHAYEPANVKFSSKLPAVFVLPGQTRCVGIDSATQVSVMFGAPIEPHQRYTADMAVDVNLSDNNKVWDAGKACVVTLEASRRWYLTPSCQ